VVKEGMNTGSIRFGGPDGWFSGKRFLRVLFVLLFWTGGFCMLFVRPLPTVPDTKISTPVLPPQSTSPDSALGPMRMTRWDPGQGHRLQVSISLDGMTVEPGNLGLFKTGLFKTVQVRSLRVRRYEYQSDAAAQGAGMEPEETALRVLGLDNPEQAKGLLGTDQEPLRLNNGMEIRIDRPDISDAGQVLVENFDYRIFYEGKPRLSISSKRAVAAWDQSGILLRGGVVVTAADGATLRTNRLQWDPKRKLFAIDGNYLLSRGDSLAAGRNICLDEHLYEVENVLTVTHNEISEEKNYAKR
jgi:hypothetical protein